MTKKRDAERQGGLGWGTKGNTTGVNREMRKGDTRREVQGGMFHFARESKGHIMTRSHPCVLVKWDG